MAVRKLDNGKWYAEVYLGTDPITGKKIRKTKTFNKQKDAKDWEREIIQSYKTGELNINKSMSVGEYLDYWYDTYVLANTKYNTQRRYRTLINCIKDHLGHMPLDELKTPHVDRFYADLKLEKDDKDNRRYSNGTILKVHRLFHQAIEKAIAWNLLIKNPVKYATKPQDDNRNMEVWNLKQVDYFLENIKDAEIYNVYYPTLIAVYTGLRVGEVAALKWENVNLREGSLMVKYNAVEKKGEGVVLEEPKTEKSKDKVMLPDVLTKELKKLKREHKKHKLEHGIDLDFVCCWPDGRPLRPTYISKAFKYHVERLNMPYITFHGLRHTHASILFELGASSQEISKRLRHSRVSTTDDIYIHLKEDTKKSTADLFNRAVENLK